MIYADHNATTPMLPEVLDAVAACMRDDWGNPSASYRFGAMLRDRIEEARASVAQLIGARSAEIVFTSGATEANVTALNAAAQSQPHATIVTTAVEHSSVLEYLHQLEQRGSKVVRLGVTDAGEFLVDELLQTLEQPVSVVSAMWANNETGVVFPIEVIGEICRKKSVPFHCDAVQAVGKIPVNVESAHATYLSLSGHKIGGPKGVGALFCRTGATFVPLVPGGHQQSGRRGGTENVPGVVGLGVAADLARKRLDEFNAHTLKLRTEFERQVKGALPTVKVNGEETARLPNTTNLTIPGVNADALLMLLDQEGICVSTGSACLADSEEPSHVIRAMTRIEVRDRDVIRVSFATGNTLNEVQRLTHALKSAVSALSLRASQAFAE